MKYLKRQMILFLVIALPFVQMPIHGLADTGTDGVNTPGITKNEPQIANSEEAFFPGTEGAENESGGSKALWVAVGVAVLAGILVAASGGGGGGDGGGGSPTPASGSDGSVTVDW